MLCTAKEEMTGEVERFFFHTSIPLVQCGRETMDSALAVKRRNGVMHVLSCIGMIFTFVLMLIISQRMIENDLQLT